MAAGTFQYSSILQEYVAGLVSVHFHLVMVQGVPLVMHSCYKIDFFKVYLTRLLSYRHWDAPYMHDSSTFVYIAVVHSFKVEYKYITVKL